MKQHGEHQRLMYETIYISVFSVALQALGLLLNIFLTRRLGAASVGSLTLIGSFYALAAVLSGGSGFIATSRFVSEEISSHGNPACVFRYSIRFCSSLSVTACILICVFAPWLVAIISRTGASVIAIRILALTLPLSALSACLKGRCYAYHRIFLPAISECIEFLIRAGFMAFFVVFYIQYGKLSLLTAFAIAMLAGQSASIFFLALMKMPVTSTTNECHLEWKDFLRLILPIVGNSCLISLLSSANDALVPLSLVQFGNSTEQALAQFGEFEAIIIPTLFFPSVIQCCMSGLLVPELSHARSVNDTESIKKLTQHVLEQTASFSFYIVLLLMLFGPTIGTFLGGDAFAGQILQRMAPIVPFIYLEIIMEGVLRGLGKQNFSSVNYLAEYVVRISVLLICVPLFGFYGIVASYIACNLTGNSVRMYFVLMATELKPNWNRILLRPLFAIILSWQLSRFILWIVHGTQMDAGLYCILFSVICGVFVLMILHTIDGISESHRNVKPQYSCIHSFIKR